MKGAAAYVASSEAPSRENVPCSNNITDQEGALPYQKKVKDFYLTNTIQIIVALIIFMNFVTAAIQSQILPLEGTRPARAFAVLEYFYVYIFLIELIVNMYGHYFWEFWSSGWNWFDFIIVVISLLALHLPDLPAIHVLRLFRAFRVVRIFKRVNEMRKIIEGIMKSLPSLSYAFVAMGLIVGIWAIMGVDFFGDVDNFNGDEDEMLDLIQRGDYYFGNFFRACLTLGQISTFDSWSSGIARDIIYEKGNGAAVYFLSFIFIAGIIMMNVLVALLLDSYLSVDTDDEEELETDRFEEHTLGQFTSYARENKIDLDSFARYLNNKAIPEFMDYKYDQQTSEGASPSAIIMNVAKHPHKGIDLAFSAAKDPDAIYGILSRIEKRLSTIEDTNDQLTAIFNRLDNSGSVAPETSKSLRINLGETED